MKENLLAEYQREAPHLAEVLETSPTDMDDEQMQKLDEMEQRAKMERYVDILNVHAAAVNASVHHDRTFRSHDDTMNMDKDSDEEQSMMVMYGLAKPAKDDNEHCSRGNDDDDDYYR